MPSTFNAPVLQVDANIVKLVDISNPQALFNLWSMMSRCADSLPQGRRLENLIWRLLMEEVPKEHKDGSAAVAPSSTSLPRDIQLPARKSSAEDVPRLSGSVDSFADEEAVEFSDCSPVDIVRPMIRRQNSSASYPSRRERHISSDNIEKMVASIVEQKDTISAPLPEIPASISPPKEQQRPTLETPAFVRSGSTTTEESPSKESDGHSEGSQVASSPEIPTIRTTTVVRGFSPAQHPNPAVFTSKSTTNDIPEPKSSPAAKQVQPKKKPKFMLGASSEESYSDDNHSVETRPTLAPPAPVPVAPKKMFQIGGSSEEESSLKSALASPRNPKLTAQKKATSFANHLTTTIPSVSSSAIMEDDEVSYDESAIESDDDDDWEDSNEDSGTNSVDEKTFFKRVDSSANLPSRRSLISLALENNMTRPSLGGVTSQSTSALAYRPRPAFNGPSALASPNDSDDAPLTMKRQTRGAPMRPINEIPRSTAQPRPIMTTASNGVSQQPMALSPRTTRRNMLATELTESLRRDLLHERSQLKRRHTSTNIVNMAQQARQPQPPQPYMHRGNGDMNASSWDQDFSRDAFAGYHSKGW
ncbi:unnamed protein product [Discula destructiva]